MNFNNKNRTLSIRFISWLSMTIGKQSHQTDFFFLSHHLILLILGNLGNSYLNKDKKKIIQDINFHEEISFK